MDLATENRIALLLMQEATKLKIEAEKEGVHAYLQRPKVRGRPNSRFLTATVLGVQQANKATEVSKMWGVRKKEIELDKRVADKLKYEDSKLKERGKADCYLDDARMERTECRSSSIPNKRGRHFRYDDDNDDGELGDEEMEAFLHSRVSVSESIICRVKRGRGDMGSRVDETGPYLSSSSTDPSSMMLGESYRREREEWEQRAIGLDKSSTSSAIGSESFHACNERKDKGSSKGRHRKEKSNDKKKKEKKKHKKSKHSHKRRHRSES